jgi:predicted nucleic acid-binding protein
MLRDKPEPRVVHWLQNHAEDHLFLSALVLGELSRGVALLEQGKKRVALEGWIQSLEARFDGRVLDVNDQVCVRWGMLSGDLQRKGIALPMADGLIAATGLVHKMTVVTRNVKDMQTTGVKTTNPWG